MDNLNRSHADAAIKGLALGILTYVGAKLDLTPELIAVLLPAVAAGLSYLSTKIGDKKTALILGLPEPVVAPAPVKKAVKKAAPAKAVKK